jgi:hypothetical protein
MEKDISLANQEKIENLLLELIKDVHGSFIKKFYALFYWNN